jgi:CheY-like chemotaxis protein
VATRVLLVDDSADVRLLLHTAFCVEGDEVVGSVGDGASAIEMARRHQPDAVVLDVVMPVMNGIEALPRLRHAAPDAVVVVYSSLADAGAEERALAAGAHAFFEKSTTPVDLAREVRELAPPTGD